MLKHLAAVLLALALLNAFCWLYYDVPPLLPSENGATDVVRRPNARKAQAREGFAVQQMDENGYNDPVGAGEDIDVLFMGSSHLEGAAVPTAANAAALLEAGLAVAGQPLRVYNIGMSAHTLPRCAANLGRALEIYRPGSLVIIETASVVFPARTIAAAREDRVGRIEADGVPLPRWVSDRPLFKNLYKQAMELLTAGEEAEGSDLTAVPEALLPEYEATLAEWFGELRATAEAAGVRLMICYHPHLVLRADGGADLGEPAADIRAFGNACAAAGVGFVDLSGPFLDAYAQTHVLPHGFDNTAMGVGHLNRTGHWLMAEALTAAILAEGGEQP